MVGRELPNLRPKREDHRSAIEGHTRRITGRTIVRCGTRVGEWWKSWRRARTTTTTAAIRTALGWPWDTGQPAIRFIPREPVSARGTMAWEHDTDWDIGTTMTTRRIPRRVRSKNLKRSWRGLR